MARHEMRGQQWYVFHALLHRGQRQADGPQSVEQIPPERTGCDETFEVTIRCGDEPEIAGLGLLRADGAKAAFLQHAQKRLLELHGHVADLIEEERPAVGLLDEAFPVVLGPGKRAAHMPEQHALDE